MNTLLALCRAISGLLIVIGSFLPEIHGVVSRPQEKVIMFAVGMLLVAISMPEEKR